MGYLVTLTPLEPFFFGGATTFGALGGEDSTYLVKSRQFPQQTALLGMIRKEILIQSGLLTQKVRGLWVDDKPTATKLIGDTKFLFDEEQTFGVLNSISPIFLMRGDERYIKKVDIDSYEYRDGLLKGYNPKKDIYNHFISIDGCKKLKASAIFKPIEQIGIQKGGGDDAYFKKTSYILKHNFKFAFYIESDFELKDSLITLGAETSSFRMDIKPDDSRLEYRDKHNYLTLLSDAYITLPIKEHCKFAITSEISFGYLQNEFRENKRVFKKSQNIWLYEKGSIFIKPKPSLIENLKNKNLHKIGLNIHTHLGEK